MATLPFQLPAPLYGQPSPGDTVTTVFKEDFVGRDLTNTTPGSSHATDFLGRNVGAGNRDFMGRGLTSEPHTTSTAYTEGTVVYLADGAEMTCIAAGTSGGSPPFAPPAVGDYAIDGTVIWRRTE